MHLFYSNVPYALILLHHLLPFLKCIFNFQSKKWKLDCFHTGLSYIMRNSHILFFGGGELFVFYVAVFIFLVFKFYIVLYWIMIFELVIYLNIMTWHMIHCEVIPPVKLINIFINSHSFLGGGWVCMCKNA